MEAVDFYETPITPYETTKRHTAEDRNDESSGFLKCWEVLE
jgi:hypothetical protein